MRLPLLALAASMSMVVRVPAAWASCGSWSRVTGAAVTGALADVSAGSATDVWAVESSRSHTLTEHWDGSVWRRVPAPNPAPRFDTLKTVVAVTPNDAWAAGIFGKSLRGRLLLHWDGSAWHRTPLPGGARHATISDLAALSPSDVWAVGAGRRGRTRTLHYDGSAWRVIRSLTPGGHGQLYGVAAMSPTDVWAVGGFGRVGFAALVEHWNGTAWQRSLAPHLGGMFGVAGTSSSDLWAISAVGFGGGINHWDGHAWTRLTKTAAGLAAVAAAASTDAWAVGQNGNDQPALVHWDGATWTESGIGSRLVSSLESVAAVPGTGDYWAVGETDHQLFPSGGFSKPRIEFRC